MSLTLDLFPEQSVPQHFSTIVRPILAGLQVKKNYDCMRHMYLGTHQRQPT